MNDPPPPTGERIVAFAQAGKPKLAVFRKRAYQLNATLSKGARA
jgi:hypothetical protein